MKKILLTITLFLVTLLGMAQSPFLMNYQGVARNAVGNVIPNQLIGLSRWYYLHVFKAFLVLI